MPERQPDKRTRGQGQKYMNPNRRDFIKFIVSGSVAAGCPVDLALVAGGRAGTDGPGRPEVDGEDNEICHRIRDGHHFDRPPVSARHDVVIVGGGVSGLAAAYLLRQRDFLLLEKEPHWGGNAHLETYQGQAYATGAAFVDVDERASLDLAQELGLEMLPVNNPDGTILRGEFIADTWGQGLDRLPYPQSVRESFKKCRKDLGAIEVEDRERELELDNEPFSKYFHGYGPDQTRGYPLYVSAPGTFTRVQPVSRRPMERIVFANTDSEGPLSLTDRGNRGSSPCGSPSG